MLSLNLLPPERKESFYWRTLTKGAIFWGGRLLIILVFFSMNFLMINLYLYNQASDLDQIILNYENTDKVREIKSLEMSAREINNTLEGIDKIGENQIYWDDALDEVMQVIPSEVQIYSLEIDPTGKFVIIGIAKTREQVLALQSNLNSSPDFKDIQFPYDNLTKPNDVEFKFTGTFLLDKFKASEKVKTDKADQT